MEERLHCHLKDTLRASPREDTNISPAQALYGAPLVLPNQYLSINNEQTMNEFIIQIDNILKNLPMIRHNTAADKELPEYLPHELGAADCVWVHRGGHATALYDGPYAVLRHSATRRTRCPPCD